MGRDYAVLAQAAPGFKTLTPKEPHSMRARCVHAPARLSDGPQAAAGLSKPHIRTDTVAFQKQKPSITWYPGASLVDVHVPSNRLVEPPKESPPRGKISEWSAASRARLKFFLGTIRREKLGTALVVTLTYPAEFPAPEDHAVYKGHLHTFQIYLRRQWPSCSGIWKLEFQTRGAAHFHLMLFGLCEVELESVRTWVRETWYKIAHNGDNHLGVAGTQVDHIKSIGGAVCYLVKYLNKGDQTMPGNFTGRYWGKINITHLPAVQPETLELDEKTAIKIRRIAKKKIQKDVEESRWKPFLKQHDEQFWRVGGRLFWETLKSVKHGAKGKRMKDGEPVFHHLEWMFKDERPIEYEGMKLYPVDPWQTNLYSIDMLRPDVRKLPKRWKPRNNDRVRLLCDCSTFVGQILRAFGQHHMIM